MNRSTSVGAILCYFLISILLTITSQAQNLNQIQNKNLELIEKTNLDFSYLEEYLDSEYYASLPEDSVYQPVMLKVSKGDSRVRHLIDNLSGNVVNPFPMIQKNRDNNEKVKSDYADKIDFVEIGGKVFYQVFIPKENLKKYFNTKDFDINNYTGFILLEICHNMGNIAADFLANGADSVTILNNYSLIVYKPLQNLDAKIPIEKSLMKNYEYLGFYEYTFAEYAPYVPLGNIYPEDFYEQTALRTTNSRHFIIPSTGEIEAHLTIRPTSYPILPNDCKVERITDVPYHIRKKIKWVELPAYYPVETNKTSKDDPHFNYDETYYGYSVYTSNYGPNLRTYIFPSTQSTYEKIGAMNDGDLIGKEREYFRIHETFDVSSIPTCVNNTNVLYFCDISNLIPTPSTTQCDGIVDTYAIKAELKHMTTQITSSYDQTTGTAYDFFDNYTLYNDVASGDDYINLWTWTKGEGIDGVLLSSDANYHFGTTRDEGWFSIGAADFYELQNHAPSEYRAVATRGYNAHISVIYSSHPLDFCDFAEEIEVIDLPYDSGSLNNDCSFNGRQNPNDGNDTPSGSICGTIGATVWYKLTGTGNSMKISTENFNTTLKCEIRVFTGDCDNLTEIACNSSSVIGGTTIDLCSSSGTTYYICIGNYTSALEYAGYRLTVVDNPIGTPTLISASSTTICSGETVTLTSSPGTNGEQVHWYSSGCGSGYIGSGNSIDVNPTTTTTYYARTYDTDCLKYSSACRTKTITVETLSTTPHIVGSSSICSGGSITLLAIGGTAGTGSAMQWYSGSCGSTVIGTSTSVTVSPSSTTTYFVQRTGDCNTTLCDSHELTILETPTAPTTVIVNPSTVCSGTSTSLTLTASGGDAGSGAVVQWYKNGCGSTYIGTGNPLSISQTISSNTTYYARYNGSCGVSACGSTVVSINTASTIPTTISGTTTICNGASTILTVSGGTHGSGATYQWYAGGCGSGGILSTGTTLNVSPTSTTTYYVRRTNACNTTSCLSKTVTVNSFSTAPTSISGTTTICNGGNTNLTAVGGSNGTGAAYQWYASGCGSGSVLGTGITLNVSPTSTTTYYVRRTGACNTTACVSTAVTVNTAPTAPTGISGTTTICSGNTTTLTATGGTEGSGCIYQWGTGTIIGSNIIMGATLAIYTTPNISSPTIFWVRRIGNSPCSNTTGGFSLSISISDPPTAPTSISGTSVVCSGNTTTLTATGGSEEGGCAYQWGTGSIIGSNEISGENNASYSTPSIVSTTTYWVRRIGISPCENITSGATQTVTVNTLSTAPTSISGTTTICNGGNTNLTAVGGSNGTGASYQWYASGCGSGSVLGTGVTLNVSPTSTTTYYVRRTGTCNTTACVSTTVTVNSLSTAPTSISGTTTICNGGNTNLTVVGGSNGTGASYQWYAAGCGSGSVLGTGITLNVSPTSTTTYYVRRTGTCNTTGCASVTVTVNSLSTAPTSISGTTTICNGGNTNLTAVGGSNGTGASYQWYASACGSGSVLGTGVTLNVSPTSTTTYYVRRTGTCNTTACVSTTVTVNTLSTAPTSISGTTTICNGGNTNLTAVGGSNGTGASYQWYASGCGSGSVLGTGVTLNVSPTSTTTYYVRRTGTCNTTGCASVTVTVNSLSIAPTSISGTTTICNGGNTILTAVGGSNGTGASYQWYASGCGSGAVLSTSSTLMVSPSSTTTYYVRRTGTCNTTGCASVSVTVNSLSIAPTSISGTTTICNGGNTILTAVGGYSGTNASYQWYASGCGSGSVLSTGSTLMVSPSSTTTYYVRRTGICNTTACASVTVTVYSLSTAPTSISGTTTICNGGNTILTAVGGSNGTGASYQWYASGCGSGAVLSTSSTLMVSPSSTTTYYVRRTGTCNTTGCASVSVTVNSLSIAPTSISGTTTICNGGNTILTAVGGSNGTGASYQWYAGGCASGSVLGTGVVLNVSPTSTTTYYVRRTGTCNTTGCASVTVTVNSLSTAPTSISGTTTMCNGENTILTAVGGSNGTNASYQWYASGCGSGAVLSTGVTLMVSPSSNTTYYVRRTGTCNTTACASQAVTINPNIDATISISSAADPVCVGKSNIFTASITNGGTPTYQWKLNGMNVATNSNTYNSSTLSDGDDIQCILTSTETCLNLNPVSSNTISISVSSPSITGLSSGDFVWSGNSNNNWETSSNWLVYNGSTYDVASIIPDVNGDVFLRAYSPCATNPASVFTNSTANCNNISIESQLNASSSSIINVYGNWANSGTFNSGDGTVNFAGNSQQTIEPGGDSFANININNSYNANSSIEILSACTIDGLATFTDGIVTYSGTGSLSFSTTSSCLGGNANSFVDGIVEKIGNSSFVFPTGDVITRDIGDGSSTYRISGNLGVTPSALATINAEYRFTDIGLPDWWYHDNNMEASLDHITNREYWNVNSNVNLSDVSLYWVNNAHANNNLCVHSFCEGDNVFNSSDLTVAYWTGTIWRDAGSSFIGDHDDGYIESEIVIPFGAKSNQIVTFGSKDNLAPLPIELVEFNANCEDNNVFVNWTASSETNNLLFILEKSDDMLNYNEIAEIAGAGFSNQLNYYNYTDKENTNGTTYYRLKQIDFDGSEHIYSSIVIICDNDGDEKLVLYPNPFTNNLNLSVLNTKSNKIEIELYNELGQLILRQEKFLNDQNKIALELNDLSPGVYQLKVKSGNNCFNEKIIKY